MTKGTQNLTLLKKMIKKNKDDQFFIFFTDRLSIQTTFQNLLIVRYALIKNGFLHEILVYRMAGN